MGTWSSDAGRRPQEPSPIPRTCSPSRSVQPARWCCVAGLRPILLPAMSNARRLRQRSPTVGDLGKGSRGGEQARACKQLPEATHGMRSPFAT
jgi:hypothetical protein